MDGNWIGLSTLCLNIRIHRGYMYMFLINYNFSSIRSHKNYNFNSIITSHTNHNFSSIGSQNSHLISQLASNLCLRDFRFQ